MRLKLAALLQQHGLGEGRSRRGDGGVDVKEGVAQRNGTLVETDDGDGGLSDLSDPGGEL